MGPISFPFVRVVLYLILATWTFILFCLCCARLNYTDHPRDEPSLFDGLPFYDPSIAELLVSTILTLIYIPTVLILIRKRSQHAILGRAWFEIACLSVLWLFWVSGAGAATNVWPNLSWCGYSQCHLLEAVMAFAWLGWITITFLLVGALFFVIRGHGFNGDLHESWGTKGVSA